jgi:hypothetical protein
VERSDRSVDTNATDSRSNYFMKVTMPSQKTLPYSAYI